MHSEKFEECKAKYSANFMTEATLRKWVLVDEKKPGSGITPEEFDEITGIPYSA